MSDAERALDEVQEMKLREYFALQDWEEAQNKIEVLNRRLAPQLRYVAMMSAVGKAPWQIAEEMEVPVEIVEKALKKQDVANEILRLQEKHFKSVESRINSIGEKSLKLYDDVLSDNVPSDTKDKINVARDGLNRAYGKPRELIQVESATLKDLFQLLDQKLQKPLDFKAVRPDPDKVAKVIDTEATLVTPQAEEPDELDRWMSEHLPSEGIGKGSHSDQG